MSHTSISSELSSEILQTGEPLQSGSHLPMTASESADKSKLSGVSSSELSSAHSLMLASSTPSKPSSSKKRRSCKRRIDSEKASEGIKKPVGEGQHLQKTRRENDGDASDGTGPRHELLAKFSDLEAENKELMSQNCRSLAELQALKTKVVVAKQKIGQAEQERCRNREILEGLRFQLEWPEADPEDFDHYGSPPT